MGTSWEILFLHIWTSKECQIWKRRAPKHDEDPSKNFLEIMDMGPISIKKHEWIFANMVPISITEHKTIFLVCSIFEKFGIIFLGPTQSSSHKAFMKNGILRWWDLDEFRKSENKHKMIWEIPNLKTEPNPTESKMCLQSYGICLNVFEFGVGPKQSASLNVLQKKRTEFYDCGILINL